MKKALITVSVILNLFFLVLITYTIYQKGGVKFIKEKTGLVPLPEHNPHYYERKSLFEILPKDSSSIIFLGNSITEGCEWSELFNNPKIKNRGIGGDDTQGVLDRIDVITSSMPRKIFLMIGINDFGKGRSINDILINYEQIVKIIQTQSPRTTIYIQSLLPVDEAKNTTENNTMIKELNVGLESLSKKYQTSFINLYPMFIHNGVLDSTMSIDGIHLNGAGYLKWKAAIINYLN